MYYIYNIYYIYPAGLRYLDQYKNRESLLWLEIPPAKMIFALQPPLGYLPTSKCITVRPA